MKKFLLSLVAAVIGINLALATHSAFMRVEAQSGAMLPVIAPGQKVVVYLLTSSNEIKEGDIIAFRPPYYTLDGEKGILLRRVEQINSEEFVLSCDANMTEATQEIISKTDLLGRVVMY